MPEIQLSNGGYAIVEKDSLPMVSGYRWYRHSGGYAAAKHNNKTILMHRLITSAPSGMEVDHINNNRLDNTVCNLRICTRSQNGCNQSIQKNKASKWKGVVWFNRDSLWKAQIKKNKKNYHLGYFKSEDDAAIAYNMAAISLFGEYANINKVA